MKSKPLLDPPLDRGGEKNPCPVKGKGRDRVWIEVCFWIGVACLFLLLHKFIVKEGLIGVINQNLPGQEAGLLAGMVWGDRSGFGKEFYTLLQTTGIVHIVVVSGTNVMLVATLLIESLAYLVSRKRAIIIGMVLMAWYIVMVGLEPPVLRAGLLLGIFYGAQLMGRRFDLWRALGLAIGIMVIADWRMVLSLSFWLSVMAYMGVVTANRLPRYARNDVILGPFWQTIWISLWITPILAMVFGKISIVGPFINVMVLFLVETVTIIGLLASLGGLVVPILGKILWLSYPMLHYMVVLVEMVGKWRWAALEITFNWWIVAGWYVILGYWLVKRR